MTQAGSGFLFDTDLSPDPGSYPIIGPVTNGSVHNRYTARFLKYLEACQKKYVSI
jgi:hypothetical protein